MRRDSEFESLAFLCGHMLEEAPHNQSYPPFRILTDTKNMFLIIFRALTAKPPPRAPTPRKISTELFSGSGKSPTQPTQGKGALPRRGLLPKQASAELFPGLSQEVLARAPGHLLNKIVIKCLVVISPGGGVHRTFLTLPYPEPLLKKEASPAVSRGKTAENALEASNALKIRAWGGVRSRTLEGNFRKSSESVFGVFLESHPESPSCTWGIFKVG